MKPTLTTAMKIGFGMCAALILQSCAQVPSTPEPGAGLSWSKVETPIFPVTWSPTENTIWVSYTFAYGTDPSLMDGMRVSPPLVKTEWKNGSATTTETGNKMEVAAIQGVLPLDNGSLAILETKDEVAAFCLSLTALPDPGAENTKDMLKFYAAWFKYNSAILDWIQTDHAAFIAWIEQNTPEE